MRKITKKAFTLIELLMVIAIIGILAGILIPTVGAVRKQANIAASKSQLNAYVNAIQMFKNEYKYLPFAGTADSTYDLSAGTNSVNFIQTLSGRNATTGAPLVAGGNRKMIAFHSFSESEFVINQTTGVVSRTELGDRFGNEVIKFRFDGDGDGFVTPDVAGGGDPERPGAVRALVTAWVEEDRNEDRPGYGLWE